MTQHPDIALAVSNLCVSFKTAHGWADVVRGIDLQIRRGETLALVGESGSGKSMTALALMGLQPSSARSSGRITVGSRSVTGLNERQWNKLRGKHIGMIFQNPMSSLNPVLTIGEQLAETINRHQRIPRTEANRIAIALLDRMKLPEAALQLGRFPHELSGGMRQRVMIAIAIANRPDVLIADEPTTALDASVQKDILDLLDEIRKENGTAIMLITHDLSLVAHRADRVAVMYAGSLVEEQPADDLIRAARHPYAKALIGARPLRRPRLGPRPRLTDIPGQVPSPADVASNGCSFAPRCAVAVGLCTQQRPNLHRFGPDQAASCHLVSDNPAVPAETAA
ncbi:ABC transporter ATP-binding protein [Afipia sp. DC4300-2b1]|uniref:ABC transporter ATP-binding protein n=1 Tax=Afipia sp. DC4300-2b1 TaxID=2804672 RepID=UPI003CF1DC1A